MRLYNLYEEVILEGLITEGVNTDQIISAIDGEYANNGKKFIRRVKIHYDGDDATDKFGNVTREGKGWRDIVVHAMGNLKNGGREVIRAYQVYGDTLRGGITRKQEIEGIPKDERGWKLFRTDRITHWQPTNLKYWEPIEIAGQPTNMNGDDSMVGTVEGGNIKVVNFAPQDSDPTDTINKDNVNIQPQADTYKYDNADSDVKRTEPAVEPETDEIPTFDTDKEGVGFDDERIKDVLDTDTDSDYEEEDVDIEDDNDEIKDY